MLLKNILRASHLGVRLFPCPNCSESNRVIRNDREVPHSSWECPHCLALYCMESPDAAGALAAFLEEAGECRRCGKATGFTASNSTRAGKMIRDACWSCGFSFDRATLGRALESRSDLPSNTEIFWYEKGHPIRRWFRQTLTVATPHPAGPLVVDLAKDEAVLLYPDGRTRTLPIAAIAATAFYRDEGVILYLAKGGREVLPGLSWQDHDCIGAWSRLHRYHAETVELFRRNGIAVEARDEEIPRARLGHA